MHILDNVYIWNFFRKILDLVFGLYRGVARTFQEFGIDRSVSILDVGCGTGQHSVLTDGDYLGLDMDCRYIDYARKKYGTSRKQFECSRLQDAKLEGQSVDVALLVDLLHHISSADVKDLLSRLSKITRLYLVTFDPVIQSPGNYLGRFLTSRDRGKFIRSKKEHLDLIGEYFEIIKVKDGKNFFTEGLAVLARPKKL